MCFWKLRILIHSLLTFDKYIKIVKRIKKVKKTFSSFVLVLLLISTMLISGCFGGAVKYKFNQIVSMSFYEYSFGVSVTSGSVSKCDAEDQIIESIFEELSKINFNKKRPKVDFWTRKPIEYKTPNYYAVISVQLESNNSYSYYFFDNRAYKSLTGIEYSEEGTSARNILRHHIQNVQNPVP